MCNYTNLSFKTAKSSKCILDVTRRCNNMCRKGKKDGETAMFTGEVVTTIPNDRKTCFINADSYDNKQLSGTIYNPFYDYTAPYNSLMELIFLMEELFDRVSVPGTQMRSFRGHESKQSLWTDSRKVTVEESGKLATFKIDVLFRQRASWQGVICWLEENTEECFRSFLELAQLIDSALTPADKLLGNQKKMACRKA